jgi:aminoglycoside phosphotransferase
MILGEIQKSLAKTLMIELLGYEWQEILVGHSAARVFRLKFSGKATVYLKTSPVDSFPSLLKEKKLLEWLREKLPVPQPLMFAKGKAQSYLLLSEIPGVDASDAYFKGKEREVIEQLAAGLKKIHSLPISDCPFDARLDYKIEMAERLMLNGLVDESDFDEIRQGKTAQELFGELIETKPAEEDLVFTHGDYCVPNIILENEKISGYVDWGNAGIADRYQDIALLARSVKYNFGEEWTEFLFEKLEFKPDLQKIHFYTLLDEFF